MDISATPQSGHCYNRSVGQLYLFLVYRVKGAKMLSFILLSAVFAVCGANGSTPEPFRSEIENNAVGRTLTFLSYCAWTAGAIWAFMVQNWLHVLRDIGIAMIAGGILIAILRAIGPRGFWWLATSLASIGLVVVMYGHLWGWFRAPFVLRSVF